MFIRVHFFKKTLNQPNESQLGKNSNTDTIYISDEANKLSQESQIENNANTGRDEDSTGISQADLPLEAFALPAWANEWISDLTSLDSEIGQRYIDYNNYKYDSLSSDSKAELNEYTDTVLSYINEELKNHGINDRVDYYTKFMQDDELSQQVQQTVTERLADNPRIMELMESFDIFLY